MTEQPSVPAAHPVPVTPEDMAVLPKEDPETLALRARPPRAIRFKRGVIVSLMGAAAVSVVGIAWFALQPHAIHLVASGDDQTVLAKSPADTLSTLPATYGSVPKLGPPLPGDLGKPILDRQQQLGSLPSDPPSMQSVRASSAEDARQRQLAEVKAARESGLLFGGGSHDATIAGPPLAALSMSERPSCRSIPSAIPTVSNARPISFRLASRRMRSTVIR